MTIRVRKLIGAVILLALVVVWSLSAMVLAQMILPRIDGWIAMTYYILAGLGWVLPAMPIIAWMQRPDPEPGS